MAIRYLDNSRRSLVKATILLAGMYLLTLTAEGAPSVGARSAAAVETANSVANECMAIRPFYWEIGVASKQVVGGSVNADGNPVSYTQGTRMNLGSVSKWIFGAYVLERSAGHPTTDQLAKLQHRAGYVSMGKCYPNQTVGSCYRYEDNEKLTPSSVGLFDYDGGHMQRLAMDLGLGSLNRSALGTEIMSRVAPGISISYGVPLLGGGAYGSAGSVAAFLRKLMSGTLVMSTMLGIHPVCTNPLTCPSGVALATPIPADESWEYSIGYWIESDPLKGDGSFSSAGTLGFYPWVSASRTTYGLIAREADPGQSWQSVQCGRKVRKAWQTGQPQHSLD